MRQGPSPRRVRELSATLRRRPPDHRSLAGLLARTLSPDAVLEDRTRPLVSLAEIVALPYALVDAFLSRHRRLRGLGTLLLRFLAPITIPGALRIEVSR